MIHFITDVNTGNLINLTHIAKAVKLQGGELFELRSAYDDFIGTARHRQIQNLIIQIIPADGWELVEKSAHENSWQIISTPVMYFGLLASGEVKPFTYTEADFRDSDREFWRHKSSPQILNSFVVFENEAEFLKDGGEDE
ncbi:MAG: hypothetical protein ACK4VI_00460 [Alphaproteobacteria bacterium]